MRLGNFESVSPFVKRAHGTLRGGLSPANVIACARVFAAVVFFHNGGFFVALFRHFRRILAKLCFFSAKK